jgi:hypothetical protein
MLKEMELNYHKRGITKMGGDVKVSKDVYVGNRCNFVPDPAPKDVIGECEYYRWRHDNFKSRHVHCRHDNPPEYYLNYGEHYCKRFTNDLRPELSDKGKIWLDKAKLNLQKAMEKGLQLKIKSELNIAIEFNSPIELDNKKFEDFALETHAPAYLDAGLHGITIEDKLLIGKTGLAEWKRRETWEQVGEVAIKEIIAYFNDFNDFVESTKQGIKKSIKEGLKEMFPLH